MVVATVESIKKPLLYHQGILPSLPPASGDDGRRFPVGLLATTSPPCTGHHCERMRSREQRGVTVGRASVMTSSLSLPIGQQFASPRGGFKDTPVEDLLVPVFKIKIPNIKLYHLQMHH